MSPSIRRSDPEYETAMREAKELFDAAMAKSSTKGRVGRPKAVAAAPDPAAAADVDDIADLADIEAIPDIDAIPDSEAIAGAAELDDSVAPFTADVDGDTSDRASDLAAEGDGASDSASSRNPPRMRRRATDD